MINGDLKQPFVPPIDKHQLNLRDLLHYRLAALDGDMGHVSDFYFDDQNWVIRYLVANTGSWLTGRLVLLTPHALGLLEATEKRLHVKLHKKQIEDCPPIEIHKPVSRQYEAEYYRYYGWPTYWSGDAMWGLTGYPLIPPTAEDIWETRVLYRHRKDKHLQSTNAITGYPLLTAQGSIGHVKGFLVDDRNWAIRNIVVETGHWYEGKEILISPSKVIHISYEESNIHVSLSKSDIQTSVSVNDGYGYASTVHSH